MRRSSPSRLGRLDVLHEVQRHADDVADAERDRAHVHVGQPAVEQVGDDLGLARAEHLFGNLPADRERAVGQRLLVAAARELEFERAVRRRTA